MLQGHVGDPPLPQIALGHGQHLLREIHADEIHTWIEARDQTQLVGRAAPQVHHDVARLYDLANLGRMEQVDRGHHPVLTAGLMEGGHLGSVLHDESGFGHAEGVLA